MTDVCPDPRCMCIGQALPPAAPIDLATVCFASGTSPDRLAARDALEELAAWAPDRQELAVPIASHLIAACKEVPSVPSVSSVTILLASERNSVRERAWRGW